MDENLISSNSEVDSALEEIRARALKTGGGKGKAQVGSDGKGPLMGRSRASVDTPALLGVIRGVWGRRQGEPHSHTRIQVIALAVVLAEANAHQVMMAFVLALTKMLQEVCL